MAIRQNLPIIAVNAIDAGGGITRLHRQPDGSYSTLKLERERDMKFTAVVAIVRLPDGLFQSVSLPLAD